MDDSEVQKQIITLGKLLVKEFDLENSNDTLARWMAHYIAEQITKAENSEGIAKHKAEKECVDTILKLWKNRSSFPREHRPFAQYDIILKTLLKLDPDNIKPFSYHSWQQAEVSNNEEVQKWLDIALRIDEAYRVNLKHVFEQAVQNATDNKTKEYLSKTCFLHDKFNKFFQGFRVIITDGQDDEIEKKEYKEKLENNIERIKFILQFNGELLNEYEKEINTLK